MPDSDATSQRERDIWLSGVLDGFASGVHKNGREHGFWPAEGWSGGGEVRGGIYTPPANIPEKAMLIVTELSEFVEAHRRGGLYKEDEHCPEHSNGVIELADTIIRCMDLAKGLGMDIGAALVAKANYNKTREYKHGRAY